MKKRILQHERLDRGVVWSSLLIASLFLSERVVAHPGRGIVPAPGSTQAAPELLVSDAVRSVVWAFDTNGQTRVFARDVHSHWLSCSAGHVLADHVEYSDGVFRRGLVELDARGSGRSIIEPAEDPNGLNAGAFAATRTGHARIPDNGSSMLILVEGDQTRRVAITLPEGPADKTPVNAIVSQDEDRFVAVQGRTVFEVARDGSVRVWARIPKAIVAQEAGAPRLDIPHLWGISVTVDGVAYTTDPSSGRVLRVRPTGEVDTVGTTPPPWFPTGVVVDAGRLYVLEHGLEPAALGEEPRNLGPRVVEIVEQKSEADDTEAVPTRRVLAEVRPEP